MAITEGISKFKSAFSGDRSYPHIQDRVWLRIIPSVSIVEIINDDSRGELDAQTLNFLESVFKGSDAGVNNQLSEMYLPLTGALPHLSFKSDYSKVMPEFGLQSRFMAALIGYGGVARAGEFVKKYLGKLPLIGGGAGAVGGFVERMGGLIGEFHGSLDSPKVWEKSDTPPISLTSKIGFESIYDYQYYKAVEIVLNRMTIPSKIKEHHKIQRAVNKITKNKAASLFKGMTVYVMGRPLSECSIEIVAGKANELGNMSQAINEITSPSENAQKLLFALDNCYLSEIKVIQGTEEGHGIDSNGISRMATFEITFVPRDFKTVLDGITESINESRYREVKYDLQDIPVDPTDIARSVMYHTLNVNLTTTAAQYVGARLQMTTGIGKSINVPSSQAAGGRGGNVDLPVPGGIANLIKNRVRLIFGA